MKSVNVFEVNELEYLLGTGGYNDGAQISLGNYTTVKMDPFPCYAHPRGRVEDLVRMIQQKYPIGFEVDWYLPGFDSTAHFNGSCWVQTGSERIDREGEGKYALYKPIRAHIVLSGKVIPIHPAMTRYVTPHEYGHAVEDWIAWQMRMNDRELKEEYRKLRGLPEAKEKYSARNWHKTVGEIFANDFRILVCGMETDFWPHDCEHPSQNYAVIGFWQEAMKYADWPQAPENGCSTEPMHAIP